MGSFDFLLDFEFSMGVLGVRRGPIGFVSPWRFKSLDSHPEKLNMGPVSIDFHDSKIFQKSGDDSLARYLSCFRPGAPRNGFRVFRSEQKRCVTNSYTDSWWYHLGKCLL